MSIIFSLIALSVHAKENNYACPDLTEENVLTVKGGRFVRLHESSVVCNLSEPNLPTKRTNTTYQHNLLTKFTNTTHTNLTYLIHFCNQSIHKWLEWIILNTQDGIIQSMFLL
jgi:hypothetical protein